MEKKLIKLDDIYENAIQLHEVEDNYSNRTIVAVFKDDDGLYYWGYICVSDEVDIDPEDYPKFNIKNKGMTKTGASFEAEKYFKMIS